MDTAIKKIQSEYSPRGAMGQKYLATGKNLSMRLWTDESSSPPESPSTREYETVVSCGPADPVADAARAMRDHQVRRAPVTQRDGELVGVLSIRDMALAATDTPQRRDEDLTHADVGVVVESICESRGGG